MPTSPKVSLPELRTTAAVVGPGGVLTLILTAATHNPTPPALPLTAHWWWWSFVAFFGILTLVGIGGYVFPHFAWRPSRLGSAVTFRRLARRNARLRESVLRVAREMRYFADDLAERNRSDATSAAFWQRFPYKMYRGLYDRMEHVLPPRQFPGYEELPASPEAIVKIANTLEHDALQVPEDMLLD
jgi:hypothetical protein